jgi:uncharacterized protein YfaP (DUF2135 family)
MLPAAAQTPSKPKSQASAPKPAQTQPPQQPDVIVFDAPTNGWRNSSGDRQNYSQEVHYPASVVNTPEDQSKLALIAGHIKMSPKRSNASVGTLVVNGVAMPQRIEPDGRFSRPYAFDSGTNSVELISPKGSRSRVQFYDSYSGKTKPRLRVVLSWDSDQTDVDLHVIEPDSSHVYYGERVSKNGGALDVDVTTGYGPEIYSTAGPLPGTYLVYANYYGGQDANNVLTTAKVSIITEEATLNEKTETFIVPLREPGVTVLIKRFVMGNN